MALVKRPDSDTCSERPGAAAGADELTPEQRARRRLLRLAVYVPPAVIGSLAIGRTAFAQKASCNPNVCTPNCVPAQCKPRPP